MPAHHRITVNIEIKCYEAWHSINAAETEATSIDHKSVRREFAILLMITIT